MRFLDEANAKVAHYGFQIRVFVIEVAEPQARQSGRPWWKIW